MKQGRLAAAFVGLSLLTRGLGLAIDVVDQDEAAHIVGSWELLRGGLLYTDFADNKPPLVYAYYALAQLLLGRGLLAVRLFTALVLVPLTALGVSAFHGHGRRGFVAGVLFLVYGASFLGHDMLAVHVEWIALLPTVWALVLVREEAAARRPRRAGAAGVLIGLATLARTPAALTLLAVAAAGLAPGRGRRGAFSWASLAAGFVLPLAATYGLFAAAGGAQGLAFWTLEHNLGYAENPLPLGEAADRLASYLLPFLLTTGWLWWAWLRSHSQELFASRYTTRLVAWLVVCALLPAFLGLRFFPHYFIPIYLPLALGAAPAAEVLLARPLGRLARTALAYTLLAFVGFQASTLWLYLIRPGVYEETRPVFEDVATALRADACYQGGGLFVWGFAPQFYYSTGLRPASRFVVPQAGLTGYVPGNRASASEDSGSERLIEPRHWGWLMEDLARNRPTYVLDTSPSGLHRWNRYPMHRFPRLWEWVKAEYEPVGAVGRVAIYRRRGCLGS